MDVGSAPSTLLSFFGVAPQPQYQFFFPLAQPYEGGCDNLSCFWLFAYICVFLQVWNLIMVKFKVPMGPVIDSCRYF